MGFMTHQERRNRREQVAKHCQELFDKGLNQTQAYAKAAHDFALSMATVISACREFTVVKAVKPDTTETVSTAPKLSPKTERILDMLKNTEMTYVEIANNIGCTKQNVQILHKRYLSFGYDLPTRQEILERKNIAKQQQMLLKDQDFIARYVKTNDFEQSATDAGISFIRAKKVLRSNNLTNSGLIFDKNMAQSHKSQRITGRWLHVLADILNGTMNATQIAEKWKKPVPFIFNLMAEAKNAGICVPELPDGRHNPRRELPPAKNLCKTCGKDFRTSLRMPDGTRVRGDHRRVNCFDCNPYFPRKMPQDNLQQTKSSNSNDLENVGEIQGSQGLTGEG